MAKNWTVAEVAAAINENGIMNENTLDFGRRFPVTTNLVGAALTGDKNAVLQILTALPEYVTMSKLEKAFKTAIEEGTPIGPVAGDEDEDADVETEDEGAEEEAEAPAEKPAKKAAAKKEAAASDDDDLESKTGKELLEIGKELGIPVKAMKGKAMAIESIRKAIAEQGGAMNPPAAADDSEEAEEADYSQLSAKELYKLCKERGIEAEQKKPAKYYIDLLEEADSEEDSEEETVVDYSKMTAKELYGLCKERKIKAEQKKPAKYYIELLEAADEDGEESGEESEEEEWDI